jgi:hypothetical protein
MVFRWLPRVLKKFTREEISHTRSLNINNADTDRMWPIPWLSVGQPMMQFCLRPFEYANAEIPSVLFDQMFININDRSAAYSYSTPVDLATNPLEILYRVAESNYSIVTPNVKLTIPRQIIDNAPVGPGTDKEGVGNVADTMSILEKEMGNLEDQRTVAEAEIVKDAKDPSDLDKLIEDNIEVPETSAKVKKSGTKDDQKSKKKKQKKQKTESPEEDDEEKEEEKE